MSIVSLKAVLFSAISLYATCASAADLSNLYVKTFGKTGDQPIIYIHGGPDYNSHDFELTTAPKLADETLPET